MIERTAFAMAQQDVRYYLNGLLFDLRDGRAALRGHRRPPYGLCEASLEAAAATKRQIIIAAQGRHQELQRLLEGGDRTLGLELGRATSG